VRAFANRASFCQPCELLAVGPYLRLVRTMRTLGFFVLLVIRKAGANELAAEAVEAVGQWVQFSRSSVGVLSALPKMR
jgi:hypothetical protein